MYKICYDYCNEYKCHTIEEVTGFILRQEAEKAVKMIILGIEIVEGEKFEADPDYPELYTLYTSDNGYSGDKLRTLNIYIEKDNGNV